VAVVTVTIRGAPRIACSAVSQTLSERSVASAPDRDRKETTLRLAHSLIDLLADYASDPEGHRNS
jgi:hypothetical protein